MRRSGRSEFTNSAKAELFAYRRRKAGGVNLYLILDAQSKKRLNTRSLDERFLAEVAKALRKQGRQTPFRVPVAIRMHFHVGLNRAPPQIHQIPKHYLYLLQEHIPSRPPERRPLLLQDDRLVEAIFCSCSFADEETFAPSMSIEVTTLTSFVRDLELHQRIAAGDFDEIDGVRDLKIKRPYDLDDDEHGDDSIEEYRRLKRMGKSGRSHYGEKLYDALLLVNKHTAQRALLRMRKLRPVDIATLYGPIFRRGRHDELFRPLREASAASVRQISALGVVSADLGPPATQTGDSDLLKAKVRATLQKMRD